MKNCRFLQGLLLVVFLLFIKNTEASRQRRQSNPNQLPEPTFYQPPILLSAPQEPPPQKQGSYQPPIPQPRSTEYRSPLSGIQPSVHEHSSSQGYALPKQSQSVQYIPPSNPQQSFSILHHSQPSETSVSVSGGPAGISQSTAERTYSVNSKVVGSAAAQAIHKSPASEIEEKKGQAAKEKNNKNDEYVVYYYYYYDNDTSANNNLSLNFDDIPSLESYDEVKQPEKSGVHLAPEGNSVDDSKQGRNSSQARSVSGTDAVIRADKPLAQPLKPVSNVFRYGSNEVPRFPVLPNFIISEVPTTTADSSTLPEQTSDSPTTPPSPQFANPNLNDDLEDDALNNVLDNTSDLKASEVKAAAEEETITTTTPEPITTTEIPATTTTEKPRRRPSIGGGGRRRFSPSPSSSFTSSRSRSPTRGSTTTTSTTTTTTSSTPTRRSFQGSGRVRTRPGIGSRTGSRTTESSDDRPASRTTESTTVSSTTSRSRFTSSAPRRFQSSRSRSQTSSTTSTTRSPTSASPPRSRPTSRPRPNLISRNRPPRPGFLRPRPGSEPEEAETTTPTPEAPEETSPSGANEVLSVSTDEEDDSEENEETSVDEPEEPTTTEASRFSALFRSRNRSALGNRPRPLIGNRPPRS